MCPAAPLTLAAPLFGLRRYPGWCFALPELLLQAPLIATEATIWTLMVYFMVRKGGRTGDHCCQELGTWEASGCSGACLVLRTARRSDVCALPELPLQVGFVTSARILIFWCVMFFAGTCGLSLFMLLALFAKTITVAAALQVARCRRCGRAG